ncbi:hypothetical protein SDC9_168018 [bioreactor metagenome]|uniref:Uncharacterized protein n=1 Tax=bioreactor metagenome TaxID=1076179 RepID=A0A645G4B2_9ZZZZ
MIFKDRLQDPLADLRLVGRIGCHERFLCRDAAHHGGDVVPVGTRAAEDRVEHTIFLREPFHAFERFKLRNALGQLVDRAGGLLPHLLRDVGIEFAGGRDPDGLQHPISLGIGGWQKIAQCNSSFFHQRFLIFIRFGRVKANSLSKESRGC